jgi:hypothetical protein
MPEAGDRQVTVETETARVELQEAALEEVETWVVLAASWNAELPPKVLAWATFTTGHGAAPPEEPAVLQEAQEAQEAEL